MLLGFLHVIIQCKLKADRLHPRNYAHTPTDYRHIYNHLGLVMVVAAGPGEAEPLISTVPPQKFDFDL